MAEYTTPLPTLWLTLSLDELYRLYAAGVADGHGYEAPPPPSAQLGALLTTLRGRYYDEHQRELLGRVEDAPAWLAAQRTLKERSV